MNTATAIKKEFTSEEISEFRRLHARYADIITRLRIIWVAKNKPHSENVWEVMHDSEKREVELVIHMWDRYVTPLAEAWWKRRGYTIHWPENNNEPCRYSKD